MGKITILKESGNNVTASSVSGKAGDFLKEAVEKAVRINLLCNVDFTRDYKDKN